MGEDTICPTCGRDDFASTKGMRSHHAQIHGEKLRATLECEQCGDEYQVLYSDVDQSSFCSVECSNTYRFSGEKHPRWKGGQQTLECECCGGEYQTQRSQAASSRFCSMECKDTWQSERSPEDHPSWKGGKVAVTCEHCGEQYRVKQYQTEFTRFCSMECVWDYNSEHNVSQPVPKIPGNPGGLYQPLRDTLPPGKAFVEVSREYRGDECQMCGGDTALELHHIISVLAGGLNRPWNFLTLCKKCHAAVETYSREQLADYVPRITENGDVRPLSPK